MCGKALKSAFRALYLWYVQERLLSGLLAVWTTAAASAGIKLPGAGEPAGVPGAAVLPHQCTAANKLLPLLPPFLSDIVLAPQLATLKDGRWGLLNGRLSWQVCPRVFQLLSSG